MPIIATYLAAKALRDRLEKHGVHIKPETFSMKTSGIYIPLYQTDTGIPYEIQPDGSVKWFFFMRFANGHKDWNVGEMLLFEQEHGLKELVHRILHIHHA